VGASVDGDISTCSLSAVSCCDVDNSAGNGCCASVVPVRVEGEGGAGLSVGLETCPAESNPRMRSYTQPMFHAIIACANQEHKRSRR